MKSHSFQPNRRPQEKTDPIHSGGIIPKFRASLLIASLGFATLPAGAASMFTEFLSFGDSLTDSGNVALAVGPPILQAATRTARPGLSISQTTTLVSAHMNLQWRVETIMPGVAHGPAVVD